MQTPCKPAFASLRLKRDSLAAVGAENMQFVTRRDRPDPLPKGGTGKILKRQLREGFWQGQEKRVKG